jgi:hypothetical protein
VRRRLSLGEGSAEKKYAANGIGRRAKMSKRVNPLARNAVVHIYSKANVLRAKFMRPAITGDLHDYDLNMDRTQLWTAILDAINSLTDVAVNPVWTVMQDPLGTPEPKEQRRELADSLEKVVTTGWVLFDKLHQDSGLRPVLDMIEALPDGSRVQINTDCAFVPWEILYPLNFHYNRGEKTQANFRPELLWGNRFIIEVLHYELNQEYKFPYKEHRDGMAYLSLNLNPDIDKDYRDDSPYRPVAAHRIFYKDMCNQGYHGDCWENGLKIKEVLLQDTNNPNVIYLYCHGSNSNPFSNNQKEELQLDANTFIDPSLIRNDHPFRRGPIVVLNSCSSGVFSALSFSNFLTTFKSRRALGLVATSFSMPASFAAAFGQRLLIEYLKGVQLGDAILKLRQDLLKHDNPLGMFYSLQCPMHVTAPK